MRLPSSFLIRMSSKGQLTIPIALRRALNIVPGTKVGIRLGTDGEFIATVHHRSRIMDFAGDLKAVDAAQRRNRKEGR
jgi:bifunctional DNA-binding transcriptional regulator/antitoxin component of YhaV-PrlF toxin-antitoxin module